jgi:hypothetical protein
VVPTLLEAEVAGNISDVDVDQQQLIDSARGDSLPDIPLPAEPLPDIPLPDVPLPGACPDGFVGERLTSPLVAHKAMVIKFGLGSCSCRVRFFCSYVLFSGLVYYTRRDVFGSLKVYFIYMFCIGFIYWF